MFDSNAPSSVRAISELASGGMRAKLMRLALARARSAADAPDLLADAIERVCDPDDAPWDPEARSFVRHVDFVMRQLADARRRAGYGRFEVVDSELAHGDARVDGAPSPDELLAQKEHLERARRLGALLEAELATRDPEAHRVLELRASGVEAAAEIASALGCSVASVYDADRRIRYRARQLRDEREPAASASQARPVGPPPHRKVTP